MTRNADIRLDDLSCCRHKRMMPIIESGQVIGWQCHCGYAIRYDGSEASTDGKE